MSLSPKAGKIYLAIVTVLNGHPYILSEQVGGWLKGQGSLPILIQVGEVLSVPLQLLFISRVIFIAVLI